NGIATATPIVPCLLGKPLTGTAAGGQGWRVSATAQRLGLKGLTACWSHRHKQTTDFRAASCCLLPAPGSCSARRSQRNRYGSGNARSLQNDSKRSAEGLHVLVQAGGGESAPINAGKGEQSSAQRSGVRVAKRRKTRPRNSDFANKFCDRLTA